MNAYGNGNEGLPEVRQRLRDGNKENRDGVAIAKQVKLEEDSQKVNGITKDVKVNGILTKEGHAPVGFQMPKQEPQYGTFCWERFLHARTLKVLLVESDDCTRHIVAALLRNCCYEVIEAANGLQAWKILENLSNHIDLVLTEVVMPCLNGIGLLCKIMSHQTRKNVPVIMMSSHDSMGLVFKCLSKGAVYFLVKPVRKNELKNLWQHVWRQCHSSSGSGSESGTQTQKSVKSKSIDKSDNTGSNDEDDSGSPGLNVGDRSDDGSGTQSSWTKQAVEVDSPRPVSPWNRVAECLDSTCAQVIHSMAEASGNKWVPLTADGECQEDVQLGKDLVIDVHRKVDLSVENPAEAPLKISSVKQYNLLKIESGKFIKEADEKHLDLNIETASDKQESEALILASSTINSTNHPKESADNETPNTLPVILDCNDKATNDAKEQPYLELGLKRLRGTDSGSSMREERNVLRRSDSSAFSRYNNSSSTVNKISGAKVGSASALDICLEMTRKGSVCDVKSRSINEPPNQCSIVGSKTFDMGSTNNNASVKPADFKNKSAASSTVQSAQPSYTHPLEDELIGTAQKVELDKDSDMAAATKDKQKEVQAPILQHHYDNQFYKSGNLQQQNQQPDQSDRSLKKLAVVAPPKGGSSNVSHGQGNVGNFSLTGSASGSNTAMNTGGVNMESDNGIAGKSESGDGSGTGTGNRVDVSKSAHREAALTKFRQKRKDRCFRKKVRYQSRKRLAEQRPRVRGQFVRQSGSEYTSSETDKNG